MTWKRAVLQDLEVKKCTWENVRRKAQERGGYLAAMPGLYNKCTHIGQVDLVITVDEKI